MAVASRVPSNKRPHRPHLDGALILATADCEGEAIEVLWQGGGSERTSRYELSAGGNRLVVLEEMAPPGHRREDRIEAGLRPRNRAVRGRI